MRLATLLVLLPLVTACNKSTPSTSDNSGGTNEEKPRDETALKAKVAERLAGRWRMLFENRPLPENIYLGYDLNSDGTFVPLDKDGNPIPDAGGTWSVVSLHKHFREDVPEGELSFKGKSAPAFDKFGFKLLNKDALGFNLPQPGQTLALGLTYNRYQKK